MKAPVIQKKFRIMEWSVYFFCIVCGALTYDPANPQWNRLFLPLYLSPLLLRAIPLPATRYAAYCLAFTFITSSLLGLVANPDYHTLQPNLRLSGLSTDNKGYRVTPPVDYRKKQGARIFAIGGSTTEEIHVADDQTWTHLVQEGLRTATGGPVEVVNTGVSGLRSVNHLATLNQILKWEPDLVIVLAGVNDWNEHIRQHFSGQHRPEAFQGKLRVGWRNRMLAKNTVLGRGMIFLKYSFVLRPQSLVLLDKKGSLDRPIRNSFRPTEPYPEFAFFLGKIGELCRQKRLPCLFLTQPNCYQEGASDELKKTFWMTPPRQPYTLDFDSLVSIAKLYNESLMRVCAERQYWCYDLASDFVPSPELFTDECHFSPVGSKRVAAKLTPLLAELLRETHSGVFKDAPNANIAWATNTARSRPVP